MEKVEFKDLDEADDFIIKAVVLETLPVLQNCINLPPLNDIQQRLLQMQQQMQQMQQQIQQQMHHNHEQLLVLIRNSTLIAVNMRASNTEVLLRLQNNLGAFPQNPLAYPTSKQDLRDNFTQNQVLALLNFYEIIPAGNSKAQLAIHIGASI